MSEQQEGNATPEQVAASRSFLDILVSVGWIIVFFALQMLTGVVAIVIALAMHPSNAPWFQRVQDPKLVALPTLWSLVVASLLLLGLLHFYLRRKDRYAQLGLMRWSKLAAMRTVVMGIAVTVIGIGFNIVYTEYIIPDVKMQEQIHAMLAAIPQTLVNKAFILVAVAVIPAIVEELLFRGLLQNSLRQRMPAWAAIGLAAFIFAAMHGDLYASPALFVLGASFGYLYEKTGSLRVNILMHMLNNSAAMLLGGS